MRYTTAATRWLPAFLVACALLLGWTAWTRAGEPDHELKGWKKGRGWGWVWGKDDEVGSLNAMTPGSVLEAIGLVKQGKVYDLGIDYDRTSYKWPGHSPGEIISFRTPEGVKRQRDLDFTAPSVNPALLAWHSCALFINDNVATQIDSLGHVTTGEDNHWYNGFTEAEWGGNFGIRKADASTIPPIVVRGILIDVAGNQGVEALKGGTAIGPKDLEAALEKQGTTIRPGDAVFVRTGTLRYWGKAGGDHRKLAAHDSAGINLEAARWLVEEKGAIMVGSDTSGLEVGPAPAGSTSFIPVHEYLLVEQGVHVAEFHYLEELAADRALPVLLHRRHQQDQGQHRRLHHAPHRVAIKIIHQGDPPRTKKTIHEGPRRTTKGH